MKLFVVLLLALAPSSLGQVKHRYSPRGRPSSICYLEKKIGPCEALIPRWYYNKKTRQCEEFFYGGCDENGNNFETDAECQEECGSHHPRPRPHPYPGPYPKPHPQPYPHPGLNDVCTLKPETGRCRAAILRWYYNGDTGRCETFTYGGCGGNKNNFESKEACEKSCGHSRPYPRPKPHRPDFPYSRKPDQCRMAGEKCSMTIPSLPSCCKHLICCVCPLHTGGIEPFGTCGERCKPCIVFP